MKRRIAAALLTCALLPWNIAEAKPKAKRAKNVILLLADAGGVSTVNAASLLGYNEPQKLFIQSWENIALSDTSTASSWVTDSAAGMTAIVTGVKTHSGVISEGPDTTKDADGTPLRTILEHAEERGLSTGVLSNVAITDATPAACFSHVRSRSMWGEIFLQLFKPQAGDGVDVLFGPGRERIWPKVKELGKDPDEVAKEFGRPVYKTLSEVPAEATRALVIGDKDFDLAAAARRAISMLSKNKKGYFLMIEADAHTDDPAAGLGRLVAFDKLIREIASTVNMDETLLLFTADHSFDIRLRGGRRGQPLLEGLEEWKAANNGTKPETLRIPALRIEGKHTGEEVIVAAKGPGAEQVRGFMLNTDLFRVMTNAYGWKGVNAPSVAVRTD